MSPTRRASILRSALAAWLLLLLGACDGEQAPLVVGSKTFAESRILGEIFAGAAEQAGIPVVRRIGFGSTEVNLEGLKRGSIDIYPEYNGTGLVLLGQPPISDGDAALERVRTLYAPLGLTWGPRLGFANNYALAMLPDLARELEIETMSDLAEQADSLTIGIEDDFLTRPLDGFDAMLSRYGMSFGGVEIVPIAERRDLYEMLVDGTVQVIEIYTTDGQLSDYNLPLLEDDLGFFPVYQAAPLVRASALERFDALSGVLDDLGAKLDVTLMRQLNNRVELLGEDPADVARTALVELGVIDGMAAATPEQPLVLAVTPSAVADGEVVTALRATRQAFPGRNVEILASADPLAEIDAGDARLALVGAAAFYGGGDPGAAGLRSGFETVGLVGDTHVHALALEPEVSRLADAAVIATGPDGSGSHQAARTLIRGLELDAELRPFAGEDAGALADAIAASGADAAIIMQPVGNETIVALLSGGARLLPVDGWSEGNNLIRFPYLRPARFAEGTYPGVSGPIETLSAQLVLAGPAETEELAVGDQGPGASFVPRALPLSSDTVRALAEALPTVASIDPVLPQAAALRPALPDPPGSINPAFDISVLTVVILIMLTWMVWLLFRPERR